MIRITIGTKTLGARPISPKASRGDAYTPPMRLKKLLGLGASSISDMDSFADSGSMDPPRLKKWG